MSEGGSDVAKGPVDRSVARGQCVSMELLVQIRGLWNRPGLASGRYINAG